MIKQFHNEILLGSNGPGPGLAKLMGTICREFAASAHSHGADFFKI